MGNSSVLSLGFSYLALLGGYSIFYIAMDSMSAGSLYCLFGAKSTRTGMLAWIPSNCYFFLRSLYLVLFVS